MADPRRIRGGGVVTCFTPRIISLLEGEKSIGQVTGTKQRTSPHNLFLNATVKNRRYVMRSRKYTSLRSASTFYFEGETENKITALCIEFAKLNVL